MRLEHSTRITETSAMLKHKTGIKYDLVSLSNARGYYAYAHRQPESCDP